jgi:glycerol kinase
VESAAETERIALEAGSSDGVYFVPALSGLGSPHWDPDARGLITGLTRGTTRVQLVRAALEAVALQVADVLDALPSPVGVLRADGGATSNTFLMQLQADLVDCPVEVSAEPETTALGAAALAGLALGVWPDSTSVAKHFRRGRRYEPGRDRDGVDELRAGWRLAVRRTLLR